MEIKLPKPRREKVPPFGLLFREKLAAHAKTKYLSLDVRILAALLKRKHGNGELSLDMIALDTDASVQGVAYAMKKLLAAGLVIQIGAGRWRLYRLSPLLYYSGKAQRWDETCLELQTAIYPEARA